MSNIRPSQNITNTLENNINKLRELRRNNILNKNRNLDRYLFPSFIKNVIDLYTRIADNLTYLNPDIHQINFPLPKEYINLIDNTFIKLFYNHSNEIVNFNEIVNNYNKIKAIVFGMNTELSFLYNMLMNDRITYELINNIYYFDIYNKVIDDEGYNPDELIILDEDEFVELIDIMRNYISYFIKTNDYEFDEFLNDIYSKSIISSKMLDKYKDLIEKYKQEKYNPFI